MTEEEKAVFTKSAVAIWRQEDFYMSVYALFVKEITDCLFKDLNLRVCYSENPATFTNKLSEETAAPLVKAW